MTSAPGHEAGENIPIGIGQLAISKDPNELLVAYGLGSALA